LFLRFCSTNARASWGSPGILSCRLVRGGFVSPVDARYDFARLPGIFGRFAALGTCNAFACAGVPWA